jgi:(p)ppGpp synthase/HD superfamily hydrolase
MIEEASIVSLARELATTAHAGQFRRDGVTPYIRHPEAVVSRVQGDPIAEAAAWLHDVVEDTHLSPDDILSFGVPAEVVEIVILLTHSNGISYERYLSAIAAHPIAKRVKIADIITNLSDSPTSRQIVKSARGLLILMR